MSIDQNLLTEIDTANKLPINRAAKEFLLITSWGLGSTLPYSVSLMLWGLDEAGISVVRMDNPQELIHRIAASLGPVKVTSLITGGCENADEENVSAGQLLAEETPEDAAELLIDSFLGNLESMAVV